VLNEGTLVLEGVTLGEVVQLVVKMLIDLASSSVLDQQTTKDTESSHPEDLGRHTGISGTLSLTEAGVASSLAGLVEETGSRPRVHVVWLLDDQAIGDEPADGLAFTQKLPSAFVLPKKKSLPKCRFPPKTIVIASPIFEVHPYLHLSGFCGLHVRELALLISETSFGSSQILRSPQLRTAAAMRF